jgi:hypothetical protein
MPDQWTGILPKNAIVMVSTEALNHQNTIPSTTLFICIDSAEDAESDLFQKMLAAIHVDSSQWILYTPGMDIRSFRAGLVFGAPPVELREACELASLPLFEIPGMRDLELKVDAKRLAWSQLKELSKALI